MAHVRPKVLSLTGIGRGCALASLLMTLSAAAQVNSSNPANAPAIDASGSVQQPAAAATPQQMPPSPPEVSYEDGQLTINASNATLGDILKAVRTVMGTEIDMPPKASRERMAAKLGPGPAREVISSLLSWTDYNYLIQASDSDPNGIQSILLTARIKSPTANPARAGRERAAAAWSQTTTQASARTEDEDAATDSSAEEALDKSSASAAPAKSSAGEPVAAASTPAAATATPGASTSASPASADGQEGLPEVAQSSKSESAEDPGAKNSERMMQLQSLYQQRKQMIEEARKPSAQN